MAARSSPPATARCLHRYHCALLCLAALCLALPAHAASPEAEPPAAAKAGKRKKPGQRVRVQPQRNCCAETPEQRDRRMYRECQGMHNAGACAGYTRPPGKRQR
jgi:hypothetical protein